MEVIGKDVYEYLLNFADDRTLLNMLQVNHKFAEKLKDDNFFKKIMERRYPLLMRFKPDYYTWKQLYLSTVKHIALLEETYGIPYIPQSEYNPNDFYFSYHTMKQYTTEYVLDRALTYAVKTGNLDIVKTIVEKGADDFIPNTVEAARDNYLDIVKYLWSGWISNMSPVNRTIVETGSHIAAVAARSNNTNIVQYMLEQGATNLNKILVYAADGGHLEIVKKMLELGATDIQSALDYARMNEDNKDEEELAKQREVIRYLENYRIN